MNIGNLFSLSTSNVFSHGKSTVAGSLVTTAVAAWAAAGGPITAQGVAVAVLPTLVGALFGPAK